MIGYLIVGESETDEYIMVKSPIRVMMDKEKAEKIVKELETLKTENMEMVAQYHEWMTPWYNANARPTFYYGRLKGRRTGTPGRPDETTQEFRARTLEHHKVQGRMQAAYTRDLLAWEEREKARTEEFITPRKEACDRLGLKIGEHGRLVNENQLIHDSYEIVEIEVEL